MRLVFKPEAEASVFEAGELRVSFASLSNDDLVGWYRSSKGTKIPKEFWTKKKVAGQEVVLPDYEKLPPEIHASLAGDDDRLLAHKIVSIEGVQLSNEAGEEIQFKDLSDEQRFQTIRWLRSDFSDFDEFRQTYLNGAQKKYRGILPSE